MSRIGYLRVSTNEQNIDRHRDMLADRVDKIFEEKISGASDQRPELQKMLDFVREGDIVYVESISRLGRSLSNLIHIIETLKAKGVGFVSMKESIDTSIGQAQRP